MGQEFIYAGGSHTIQLNYLDTAASRAIFSSFHHHGGAAYGGARGVKVGKGDGVLFLGNELITLCRRNHHEQKRSASRQERA